MQVCPENDRCQFMGNCVYGPFSLFGVFRSNTVIFYYNPMLPYLSLRTSLSYKIINKSNNFLFYIPTSYPSKEDSQDENNCLDSVSLVCIKSNKSSYYHKLTAWIPLRKSGFKKKNE